MITGATQFGDDRLFISVDEDPRLVPVNCLAGSFIVFVPSGQLFYKKDDGLSTNVTHNVNIKSNVSAVVPPTVNNDSTQFYSTGSMWINTATGVVYFLVDPTAGAAVWITFSGQGTVYQFEIGQELDTFTLPFLNAASEIVSGAKTLTLFSGRRAVPGSAGTTTIQLELNGSPIGGAILSWTPSDLAFALKTVAISVPIVSGDRLSIRLTSAETGGEDVFAEAS
jgi:hypothetical protein